MNLTEELDRSFDDGPAHRPIEDRLEAGHQLVRRRRLAASAAALVTVAVLGTAGGAMFGGDEPSSGTDFTTQPTHDPADGEGVEPGDVMLDGEGTLVTGAGVEVVRQVPNPRGFAPPRYSLGVVYTYQGATYWALEDSGPSGGGGTSEVAQQSFPTFEGWLAEQVALQEGEPTLALVEFGEGETLLPRAGVEIIKQTGDLSMMPSNFAGPNDRTAAAEVTYQGERWYVLARQSGNDAAEYMPTAASVSRPTLEQFLPYAADSFANGTGLR